MRTANIILGIALFVFVLLVLAGLFGDVLTDFAYHRLFSAMLNFSVIGLMVSLFGWVGTGIMWEEN